MTYTMVNEGTIKRDADGVFIPVDPANRDYQQYAAWVAKGNSAKPVPTSPPLPITVYAVQALLALKDAGLYDIVHTAATTHPLKEVQIWYDKAQTWEEDNPYVQGLGAELGLTDKQINNLFLAARLK